MRFGELSGEGEAAGEDHGEESELEVDPEEVVDEMEREEDWDGVAAMVIVRAIDDNGMGIKMGVACAVALAIGWE